jgi:predicted AlkP superfamily phosphohydrolase/phosphomutase
MELPNNRVGAIRLNVTGREPTGVIDPRDVGAELDALTEELLLLRQPGSGERIVHQVVRPADVYGPDHHPDLPDLLVLFRRDLGELTECEGPRSGHIEQDFRRPDYQRTGDHTAQSRVWVSSRARDEPLDIGDIDNLDLAPTLLALLEVPAPDDLDGVAIPELVGHAVGPR